MGKLDYDARIGEQWEIGVGGKAAFSGGYLSRDRLVVSAESSSRKSTHYVNRVIKPGHVEDAMSQ